MNDLPQLLSIVMVEDDEGHARLSAKNIRRAGVAGDIRVFRTGAAALVHLLNADGHDRARAGQPELLLLDLNLPDMTGIDILVRLAADDAVGHVPVIILTTTDDPGEIQRCFDLGADLCLAKPLDPETFAAAIRRLGLFRPTEQGREAR